MKKYLIIGLAAVIAIAGTVGVIANYDSRPVLKVANWAEYIDGGDEDSGYLILIINWRF